MASQVVVIRISPHCDTYNEHLLYSRLTQYETHESNMLLQTDRQWQLRKGKWRSQQGEHAPTGRELNECLTPLRQSLVVTGEPTSTSDPSQAAFDDPSPG